MVCETSRNSSVIWTRASSIYAVAISCQHAPTITAHPALCDGCGHGILHMPCVCVFCLAVRDANYGMPHLHLHLALIPADACFTVIVQARSGDLARIAFVEMRGEARYRGRAGFDDRKTVQSMTACSNTNSFSSPQMKRTKRIMTTCLQYLL